MIETSRLKLVPLNHEQLLLYKHNPEALAMSLGTNFQPKHHDPEILPHLIEALDMWIAWTKEHESQFEWYTTWEIILKKENIAIGGIGFSGYPDSEGKSMVGYGLDTRYFGQGYATEALKGLINWAFSHKELNAIVADTLTTGIPSQRVLIKNGFVLTGEGEGLKHWKLDKR